MKKEELDEARQQHSKKFSEFLDLVGERDFKALCTFTRQLLYKESELIGNLSLNQVQIERLKKSIELYYALEKDLNRILDEDEGEPEPVYVSYWFRDCDLCESSGAYKFNSFIEYKQWERDFLSDAEGPQSYSIITEEDFKEIVPFTRDRVLEAFENGHGTKVIL
ncbi:MAG: hypothetical protein OEY01_03560 [Desulfobulbaceae bacterium]|nr:hypothetical protein [Desulfobulbaceae bacterium]